MSLGWTSGGGNHSIASVLGGHWGLVGGMRDIGVSRVTPNVLAPLLQG